VKAGLVECAMYRESAEARGAVPHYREVGNCPSEVAKGKARP
jgi:hypothetical protein